MTSVSPLTTIRRALAGLVGRAPAPAGEPADPDRVGLPDPAAPASRVWPDCSLRRWAPARSIDHAPESAGPASGERALGGVAAIAAGAWWRAARSSSTPEVRAGRPPRAPRTDDPGDAPAGPG